MAQTIEFHFDFGSPNTYFVHRVIPNIEARTGATFRYVPILLGGVFKATNNKPPMVQFQGIDNKMAYQRLEIQRFIAKHSLTKFTMNPDFPINTVKVMRGAIAAQKLGCFEPYVEAIYRFMWEEPRKMDESDVIVASLNEAGLDGNALLAATQQDDIKQELFANTEASVKRGTFGAPTFYMGDEIYFGKESLRTIEDLLTA